MAKVVFLGDAAATGFGTVTWDLGTRLLKHHDVRFISQNDTGEPLPDPVAAAVRFVDEEDQAIDKDAEGEPVVDEGVLVRIGPVPEQGTTVTVPAELYHDDNDIVPTEYKVTEGSDGWTATQQSTASG